MLHPHISPAWHPGFTAPPWWRPLAPRGPGWRVPPPHVGKIWKISGKMWNIHWKSIDVKILFLQLNIDFCRHPQPCLLDMIQVFHHVHWHLRVFQVAILYYLYKLLRFHFDPFRSHTSLYSIYHRKLLQTCYTLVDLLLQSRVLRFSPLSLQQQMPKNAVPIESPWKM